MVANIFKHCNKWFSSKHDLPTVLFSFFKKCWRLIVPCYSLESDEDLLFYLLEHGIYWGKYNFYYYPHHSHKRHTSELMITSTKMLVSPDGHLRRIFELSLACNASTMCKITFVSTSPWLLDKWLRRVLEDSIIFVAVTISWQEYFASFYNLKTSDPVFNDEIKDYINEEAFVFNVLHK